MQVLELWQIHIVTVGLLSVSQSVFSLFFAGRRHQKI